MSHGKEAARDLRYGRRGGRWAPETDPRTTAEIRADHLADPPAGCRCLWCLEGTDDSPQLDMFGEDESA